MAVPAGLIFIWNSTNASIPANWDRETKLDAQFIKGTADTVDPDVTGGTATHTHTAAAHTHADVHTHTITINACTKLYGGVETGSGSNYSVELHTHTASCGAISGGGLSSITSTYSEISNNPPYYEVIFIKPSDGAQTGVPNNACALSDNSSLPSGWTEVTALRNKFLRGAATDGNAGGTGGSTTNVHDLTHTHVVAAHDHANTTSGTPSSTGGASGSDSNACSSASHTHTINVDAQSSNISATAPQLTTSETVEPAYKTLVVIKNETGVNSLPIGIVGLWLGILADIPAGWSEVTGMRSKYLKGAASTATVGATGGANTHTHASQAHIHTASAVHTHAHANLSHVKVGEDTGGSGFSPNKTSEYHTVTVANGTSAYENGSTTAASSSNEPEYTTVAYIKLDRYNYTGSFIFAML